MAVLKICKAGDKVLEERAVPVRKINRRIKYLLDDMVQTMREARGLGLAAPQVGVLLRIIVVDAGQDLIELINPKIVAAEGSEYGTEGCLSVPGVYGEVERYAQITIEGYNRDGKKVCLSSGGLQSRVFQHEVDHLEGILFTERAKTLYAESEK
jgi:peptide deformylase